LRRNEEMTQGNENKRSRKARSLLALIMFSGVFLFFYVFSLKTALGSPPHLMQPVNNSVSTNFTPPLSAYHKTMSQKEATEKLWVAVWTTDAEEVTRLIQEGAIVNAVDKDSRTLLMRDARFAASEIFRILIKNGADVTIKDRFGETLLDYANRVFPPIGAEIHKYLREKTLSDMSSELRKEYATRRLLEVTEFAPACVSSKEVTQLIQDGADVNATDKLGMTPFLRVISAAGLSDSTFEVIRIMIEKGANVNIADMRGWTPLIFAARNEDPKILETLIEKGANINATDIDGRTPLVLAIRHNQTPGIIRILIEKGADVTIKDKFGRRALYYADRSERIIGTDVYKLLREKTLFAVPDIETETRSAKEVAEDLLSVMFKIKKEELIQFIQEGADINARNSEGETPLVWAIKYRADLEIIRTLIENGANVNIVDDINLTPLMYAVLNGNNEIIPILIENGADVTIKGLIGQKALDYADYNEKVKGTDVYKLLREKTLSTLPSELRIEYVTKRLLAVIENAYVDVSAEEVSQLIQEGADINAVGMNGETPLIVAARRDLDPEIILILIENGADVGIKDIFGRIALYYMERDDKLKGNDVYELLREKTLAAVPDYSTETRWSKEATENLLFGIRHEISVEEVIQHVLNGADVNSYNDREGTLLSLAVRYHGDPKIIRVLIENGAIVNVFDCQRWTPLMQAVYDHSPEILQILVENGADANVCDDGLWTPLMFAVFFSDKEVIQILVENGADVTVKDMRGKRALDYAEENEKLKGTNAYKLLREKTLF
jgi:ankyrin repeat protein